MSLVPKAPPLTARPRPLLPPLQVFNVTRLLTGWVMPAPLCQDPPPSHHPRFPRSLTCWQAGWCLPSVSSPPPPLPVHHPRFPTTLTCKQAAWCPACLCQAPVPSNTPGFQHRSLVDRLGDARLLCVKPLSPPPPQVSNITHLLTWCPAHPSPPPPQVPNISHLLTGWVMPAPLCQDNNPSLSTIPGFQYHSLVDRLGDALPFCTKSLPLLPAQFEHHLVTNVLAG